MHQHPCKPIGLSPKLGQKPNISNQTQIDKTSRPIISHANEEKERLLLNYFVVISACMSKRKPPRKQRPGDKNAKPEIVRIFGTHAVHAALKNPQRRAKQIFATRNAIKDIPPEIDLGKVEIQDISPQDLSRLLPDNAVHQGIIADFTPLPELDIEDLAQLDGPLVILDQVTDPHNVGAILRSAAVFGACAILTTRDHSPPQSGSLAKTASGALEIVPIISVANLARAMHQLKQMGFFILGLDERGDTIKPADNKDQRLALVMGAEGKGLRRLTRENCDQMVSLPNHQPRDRQAFATLNVSNAAAVALFAILPKAE